MITLFGNDNEMISLITAEDYEPEKYDFDIGSPYKMGIQGISATEDQAARMLMGIVTEWERGNVELEVDTDVSL